ncbi:alpha/beta fold hydrolase [Thiotrichales bacterium 19S3-7]|nr:alpha/beta fold hydrolase [Thiotrichales bacterium 19S3-7]MCF6801444.1 alpha/beta fold hydrolase [Thiotrichales bacterium 19S3-11]
MNKPQRKDIHKKNHLLRWGILFALLKFVALVTIICLIDFTFLARDQGLINVYIRISLFIICLILVFLVCRLYIYYLANKLNNQYLDRFTPLDSVATFRESATRGYTPSKPFKEAVLLIHGFAASPQEFSNIIHKLKKKNVTYYAPHIIGFGLNHTKILHQATYQDWFRNALEHYDILANLSEKVHIVGHSLGGIMAVFIAQQRKVDKLILSSPGLYLSNKDLIYKKLLSHKYFGKFFTWLFPYMPKPIRKGRNNVSDLLDESRSHTLFHYLAIPTHAISEIFKAQEHVKLNKIQTEQLYVIYGKHDLTVNNEKVIEVLNQYHIPHKAFVFENSAHNCFEDYESEEASNLVIDILQNNS